MPHSAATSSRRSPPVRRRGPAGQSDVLGLQRLPPGTQEVGELGTVRRDPVMTEFSATARRRSQQRPAGRLDPLAGDPAGPVGRAGRRSARPMSSGSPTGPWRDAAEHAARDLLVVAQGAAAEVGADRAGRDGVDGDPARPSSCAR